MPALRDIPKGEWLCPKCNADRDFNTLRCANAVHRLRDVLRDVGERPTLPIKLRMKMLDVAPPRVALVRLPAHPIPHASAADAAETHQRGTLRAPTYPRDVRALPPRARAKRRMALKRAWEGRDRPFDKCDITDGERDGDGENDGDGNVDVAGEADILARIEALLEDDIDGDAARDGAASRNGGYADINVKTKGVEVVCRRVDGDDCKRRWRDVDRLATALEGAARRVGDGDLACALRCAQAGVDDAAGGGDVARGDCGVGSGAGSVAQKGVKCGEAKENAEVEDGQMRSSNNERAARRANGKVNGARKDGGGKLEKRKDEGEGGGGQSGGRRVLRRRGRSGEKA